MKKRGEIPNIVIMMALALVVLGVMLFLTYKYVYKGGQQAGEAGTCTGQGGTCKASCNDNERTVFGLGCPTQGLPSSNVWCCTTTS